jgi:hypothetical protein
MLDARGGRSRTLASQLGRRQRQGRTAPSISSLPTRPPPPRPEATTPAADRRTPARPARWPHPRIRTYSRGMTELLHPTGSREECAQPESAQRALAGDKRDWYRAPFVRTAFPTTSPASTRPDGRRRLGPKVCPRADAEYHWRRSSATRMPSPMRTVPLR